MKPIGSICIADFQFGIYNQSALDIVFETGFEGFLQPPSPTATIQCYCHQGFQQLTTSNCLYQAKNGEQLLWEIHQQEAQRVYLVYHPDNGQLQQQAFYNAATRTWNIYSEAIAFEDTPALHPFAYPMAPLMWYVLSTEEPLLLIHASGIHQDGKGRIFSGFSGVGKSTMAHIWQENGAQLINDDRLLLRRKPDGSWTMYNTPMYYQALPVHAMVNALYFPYHHPENRFEPLFGAKALAQLLAYTIHHGYDAQHVSHHSQVAQQLIDELPVAKLGVVPTAAVIDFIKAHE
ncbi:MAG: hypothetical protein RLZZ301_962 [Bacteroidota bacterium]|jgi:hypothetical protein